MYLFRLLIRILRTYFLDKEIAGNIIKFTEERNISINLFKNLSKEKIIIKEADKLIKLHNYIEQWYDYMIKKNMKKAEGLWKNFLRNEIKNFLIYSLPFWVKNLKWNGFFQFIQGNFRKGFEMLIDNNFYLILHPYYLLPSKIRLSVKLVQLLNKDEKDISEIFIRFNKKMEERFSQILRSEQRNNLKEYLKLLEEVKKEEEKQNAKVVKMISDRLEDFQAKGYTFYYYDKESETFKKTMEDITSRNDSKGKRIVYVSEQHKHFTYEFIPVSYGDGNFHYKTGNFNKRKWEWNSYTETLTGWMRSEFKKSMGELKMYQWDFPNFEDVLQIEEWAKLVGMGNLSEGLGIHRKWFIKNSFEI